MAYGTSQQIAFYSFSSAPRVLDHLALHLAIALARSDRKTWLLFVDTWDWAQTGFSRASQPNPENTSSWLADYFLPALRRQGVDLLVLAAGQIPPDEITPKFKECGFMTTTTDFDAFDETEFRQFIAAKGIQSEDSVQALERLTGRNPQLIRFWFEMAESGESPEQRLAVDTPQPPTKGTNWLLSQMRERMPGQLPMMFQAASVLPAFDREMLGLATGLVFSDEAWDRFKGYSLVEPLRSKRLKLFRIKDVFAHLLRQTVEAEKAENWGYGAVNRFLTLTDHRIHDLGPDEMARERELSLLLMRTALVVERDDRLAWSVFLREAARWIDPVDQSAWKELVRLMSPERLNTAHRHVYALLRQAWEDLGFKPVRKSRRLLDGVTLLAGAELVPLETRLSILRAGMILSVDSHRWDICGDLLSVANATGLGEDERLWDVLCRMHAAKGDFRHALDILDHPGSRNVSPETLARLGEFAENRLFDQKRAVALFRKAIEVSVEEAGPVLRAVNLLIGIDKLEEALAVALQASSRHPKDPNAARAVAVAYREMRPKDWARAAEWFEKAVRLKPDDEPTVRDLASTLQRSRSVGELRQYLEALANEFPKSTWLAAVAAASFDEVEPKDPGSAAKWYEKAVRLQPDRGVLAEKLAVALRNARGLPAAREQLEALAGELSSSAWLGENAGRSFGGYEPKDWAKAAQWHMTAVRRQPDEREMVQNLAFALQQAKGALEARKALEDLANELSGSAWLAAFTGASFHDGESKNWGKALAWYEKAVRLRPDSDDMIGSLYGALQEARGTPEARQRLESLALEFPESAWLAEITARTFGSDDPKDWVRAAYWHEMAVRLKPTEHAMISNLALALREARGAAEGLQYLESLAREFPDRLVLIKAVAESFERIEPQDWAKAVEWRERVLQLSPYDATAIAKLVFALRRRSGKSDAQTRLDALLRDTVGFVRRELVLFHLGECSRSQDKPEWDEAATLYKEALSLLPPEKHAERAVISFYLAMCLHSQTPPAWDGSYALSKEAVELSVMSSGKENAVQALAQLAFLCGKCASPPWEEAAGLSRKVVELLTADDDKPLRATALQTLALCLRSQAQPDWVSAAQTYQEALRLLTGDDAKAERLMVLFFLAMCLHHQAPPDWGAAYHASRQALELCVELRQKGDAIQVLAQLAFLCAECAPPWEETVGLCRKVAGLLTADDDKPLRATALRTLALCLHSQTQADWGAAIECSRQVVDLLRGGDNKQDFQAALVQLASLLEDQESPDNPAAAEVWKEAAEQLPSANNIIGLVMSLDRVGKFLEADGWVAKLDTSKLGDEAAADSPLSRRRQVYLALRRNDLETVIRIASELRGTPENARAMLLLSVAHFARGDHEKAREAIRSACSSKDDRTWFVPVAEAYFARHGGDISGYRNL